MKIKKMFFISLITVLFITGCGTENDNELSTEEYNAAEEKMIAAAKKILAAEGNEGLIPTAEDSITSLSLRNLEESNHLEESLVDPIDSSTICDIERSYVRIVFKDNVITYTPYLECGDYKTEK